MCFYKTPFTFGRTFGTSGLIGCNDMVTFEPCAAKMQVKELSNAPADFHDYVIRRVLPLMRQNVLSGNSLWTNNNCESINHVLKQAVAWRPQQLPDLINVLQKLVESQYTEADRVNELLWLLVHCELTRDFYVHGFIL